MNINNTNEFLKYIDNSIKLNKEIINDNNFEFGSKYNFNEEKYISNSKGYQIRYIEPYEFDINFTEQKKVNYYRNNINIKKTIHIIK